MEYLKAQKSDLSEIESLLEYYDLPASDCSAHLENFILAKEDGKLVGVGGFENCGNYGLIRSFAVLPEYKGNGIAGRVFKIICEDASQLGMSALYLLTTTASGYFKNLGFSECNRMDCPESIRHTRQFSELCPSSAVTMFRAL